MSARPEHFDAAEASKGQAQSRLDPMADVKKLRNTVEFIDALAQEGFSEICAIAKLALLALESPEGAGHIRSVAHALRAICGKAGDIENCINGEAEAVGCNYVAKPTAGGVVQRGGAA